MINRVGTILSCIIIVGVIVALMIPALSMTYVPTEEQISQNAAVRPFQVKSNSIEGVYANLDIDTLVFRYTTSATSKSTFESALDEQAAIEGWTRLPDKAGSIRYERVTPKGDRLFCSAEEVRLRFDPETKRVNIGWVQGDALTDVTSFSQTNESDWAEIGVWPKLRGP